MTISGYPPNRGDLTNALFTPTKKKKKEKKTMHCSLCGKKITCPKQRIRGMQIKFRELGVSTTF